MRGLARVTWPAWSGLRVCLGGIDDPEALGDRAGVRVLLHHGLQRFR